MPRIWGSRWDPAAGRRCGSLVSYAMEITDVPLQYGLLFERFLNPGASASPTWTWIFITAAAK